MLNIARVCITHKRLGPWSITLHYWINWQILTTGVLFYWDVIKWHLNIINHNLAKFKRTCNNFSHKLLILETNYTIRSIKYQRDINNYKSNLKNTLPAFVYEDFMTFQYSKYNKLFEASKLKNLNKLLIDSDAFKYINLTKVNLHRWLQNTTDIDISVEVACILASSIFYNMLFPS